MLPLIALLILVVELGERFTYFGLSGPIQNYINNPYDPESDLSGALGKGQAVATALGNFFKFWAYASTVIGAIITNQYLGKFKAIMCACGIYIAGLLILVSTSTPTALTINAGLGGLIAAMVAFDLGKGGIKANVTPLCAEQYTNSHPELKTLKSGEEVIVDPELTVQRHFMWFYWVVNIGALSPLITVNIEAHHSFWLAYLVPLITIILSTGVFFLGRKKYVRNPPIGSAILDSRTTDIAIKEHGFYNARPSDLRETGHDEKYPIASQERYTDDYVDDVQHRLRPMTRIFMGFMLASISMAYACVLQHYIYNSPPSSIHVWIQAPSYILVAFSEAFVIITGLELAFTQAPKK
ncbi:hypothetical protein QQZ08_010659 [Neonectria magnoliae]|uniref:Uncharacterized protein n=1 Tax=Neonectria magnoliae TaxID=2732573 RepID=A0ABR1HFA5_9HYPO